MGNSTNEGLFEEVKFEQVKNSLIKDLQEYEEKRKKTNGWQAFLAFWWLWDKKLTSKKVDLVEKQLRRLQPKQKQSIDLEDLESINSTENTTLSHQATWREVVTFREIYQTLRHQNHQLDKNTLHWRGVSNNQLKKILKKHAEKIDALVERYRAENPKEANFDRIRENLLKALKKGYLKSRKEGGWLNWFYDKELTNKRKDIANALIQLLDDAKEVKDWRTAYRLYQSFDKKFEENQQLSDDYGKQGGYLDQIFQKHKDQFNSMLEEWRKHEVSRMESYVKTHEINSRSLEREETLLKSYFSQNEKEKNVQQDQIEDLMIDNLFHNFLLAGILIAPEQIKDELYQRYKHSRFNHEIQACHAEFPPERRRFYTQSYSSVNLQSQNQFLKECEEHVFDLPHQYSSKEAINHPESARTDDWFCKRWEGEARYLGYNIKVSKNVEDIFPNFSKLMKEKNGDSESNVEIKGWMTIPETEKMHWYYKQAEKIANIACISENEERRIKQKIEEKLSQFFESPESKHTLQLIK